MTDTKTYKLDIAQRIAEALARTTEPTMSANGDFNPEEDTIIGEVPEHLRHLHNLLEDVSEEAHTAERSLREAKKRHVAIHSIFFDALEQHVPYDGDTYDGINLCTGWQVVGFKHDDKEGEMDDFVEFLAMATMNGHL